MNGDLPEGPVTILFTDVAGSTEMRTRLGDDAAHRLLREQEDAVRQHVGEHGGHEVKGLGDGLMVWFASARRAVACAAAIQRAVGTGDVRMRMGLNTGEVTADSGDLYGEAVNAAARIAAKAEGGEILVSEVVRQLTGTLADTPYRDRGRFRLKGFPDRWRLYEVEWRTAAEPAGIVGIGEARTALVGRDDERAELRRLLDGAAAGRGGVVFVGGEPGVGKTRLADELLAEAAGRAMRALKGRCYEVEGSPPYVPFVEAIEAAARAADADALRTLLGDVGGEMARLVPELRRMLPDLPPPAALPPEQERRYLFNAVSDVVERASRARPLLLVLDDVHWADESTLLLLTHLASRLSDVPALVLCTYRDVELDVARPLAATMDDLLRQRLARRLHLGRLPVDGVTAMLTALGGSPPPPSLVGVVHRETDGNPFFVEEVFKHLAEEGRLFDEAGRWRTDVVVSDVDVPEGVRLVIGRRLERLGEGGRRVLTAGAVIGPVFDYALLEEVAEGDPDAVLDAVDDAERAGVLVPASDGTDPRFAFSHELMRQTLLANVSLPRRQRLHLKVAQALVRRLGSRVEEHAADVAHHLLRAGAAADTQAAVGYLLLAGRRAIEAAAFEDGLRMLEDALSLLDEDERHPRADLLAEIARARRSLGRAEEALAAWAEAIVIYEELGAIDEAAAAGYEHGLQLGYLGRFEDSAAAGGRVLGLLGDRVSPVRVDVLAQAGLAMSWAGAYDVAEGALAEAEALARAVGDDGRVGFVLGAQAVHRFAYGHFRDTIALGTEAGVLLHAAARPWDAANTLAFVVNARAYLPDRDATWEADVADVAALGARLGNLPVVVGARMISAFRRGVSSGDGAALEAAARASLDDATAAGLPYQVWATGFVGLALAWQGRWDEATGWFERAAALEPPGAMSGMYAALCLQHSAYADAGALDGRVTAAAPHLARCGEPATLGARGLLAATAEALLVSGRGGETAPLLDAILEAGEATVSPAHGRLWATLAGGVAAAAGDWKQAEEQFALAHQLAADLGWNVEAAAASWFHATALREHGDTARAEELRADAAARYERMGMPRHVELCERLW